MTTRTSYMAGRRAAGFSLIEVLVTMVVVALGLLGFAALQTNSLKSNRVAMQRSTATIMASDIMDRIRANRSNAADYALTLGEDPTTGTVAGDDLDAWRGNLSTSLPQGTGSVGVAGDAAGGFDVTVTVQWSEVADAPATRTWSTSSRL